MKPTYTLLISLMIVFSTSLVRGQESFVGKENFTGTAIGIQAGTMGAGFQVVHAFHKAWAVKAGFTFLPLSLNRDLESGDATVRNSTATIGAVSLGGEWQFASFMHLNAGVMYNYSKVDFDLYPTNPSPDHTGVVHYQVLPNKICPYVTLGFGQSINRIETISFAVDLGFQYQGYAHITPQVTGTVPENTQSKWLFNIQSGADKFRFYPLLNFELAFRL